MTSAAAVSDVLWRCAFWLANFGYKKYRGSIEQGFYAGKDEAIMMPKNIGTCRKFFEQFWQRTLRWKRGRRRERDREWEMTYPSIWRWVYLLHVFPPTFRMSLCLLLLFIHANERTNERNERNKACSTCVCERERGRERGRETVRPDWAIFVSFWWYIFSLQLPKYIVLLFGLLF